MIRAHWDLRGRFDEYIGGVDVAGKSVLDIGTATGFLSFEAEKRGARVVSFDMEKGSQQTFLPFKDKPYYSDHDRWAKSTARKLKSGRMRIGYVIGYLNRMRVSTTATYTTYLPAWAAST